MRKISSSEKFRYKFDNLMSKGPVAMIALLALMSLLVVVIAGIVLTMFDITPEGAEPMNFMESAWQSLMRTLDSGTMGGDMGWGFRIIAFLVTLGGIFIISTLIGVLGSGIEGKLDDLRKGRSFVIEKDHTLILGWSSKVFTIISELVIANENQKRPRIVILADKDKVEMEDEVRDKIGDMKNTRVICRSGSPNDLVDLAIVNPQATRSIIVLAPEEGNPDPLTIKTILAITNNPDRREEPYHIVAEIKDEKNLEVAKMVGKDEVELVLTDDVIARIMVQTSRQSGLSIVYTELMDFDGAEIYFNEEKELVGKTYWDSVNAYEDSAVIGLQYADGSVKVNPPMDHVIQKGDKVIAITEDDDTLVVSKGKERNLNEKAIVNFSSDKTESERILLLGWNKRAITIIREMDNYVGSGSYMKVVSSFDHAEEVLSAAKKLKNIRLEFMFADTTARQIIDNLDVTSYNSVQLLCYKEEMDIQDADAQTLISLLHIRRIMEETGKDIKIVSEMLDLRNRDLAEVTKADDFIVSDKLISLLMSQVSENKFLMRVFEDLFDSDGSEIYLKPMKDYIRPGEQVNFYTVMESAKRKGETAIGYRIASNSQDGSKAYGVVVNPVKSTILKFTEEDKLIVLAED
ncbi:MAG: potassium transporter TrkA [Bacteroidota bacterium]|nr:potassium transporter TrkA [Bacteroidota bacterium]